MSGVVVYIIYYSPLNTYVKINWEATLLRCKVELEWRLKVFPSDINLWFWISPHQGMLSHSLFPKLGNYMLFHMNEVDQFIFSCVYLYKIQICYSMYFPNNWYQSGLQSHVCIMCWVSFRIKENWFHDFENVVVIFSAF